MHLRRIKTDKIMAKDVNRVELANYYEALNTEEKKINLLALLLLLASAGMFSPEESMEYITNINSGIMPDTDAFLELTELSYEVMEEHLFDSASGKLNKAQNLH